MTTCVGATNIGGSNRLGRYFVYSAAVVVDTVFKGEWAVREEFCHVDVTTIKLPCLAIENLHHYFVRRLCSDYFTPTLIGNPLILVVVGRICVIVECL